MKSPEELKSLKEEAETLNKKLAELTEDELSQVNGGNFTNFWSNAVLKELNEK